MPVFDSSARNCVECGLRGMHAVRGIAIAGLAALCLAFCTLVSAAHVQTAYADTYGWNFIGVEVGDDNAADLTAAVNEAGFGTAWGTAYYDKSENILYLSDFVYAAPMGESTMDLGFLISCSWDLTLDISGDNMLSTANSSEAAAYGIFVIGALSIQGEGNLQVCVAGNNGETFGIMAGSLIVPSGVNLYVRTKAGGDVNVGAYIGSGGLSNSGMISVVSGGSQRNQSYGLVCEGYLMNASTGTIGAFGGPSYSTDISYGGSDLFHCGSIGLAVDGGSAAANYGAISAAGGYCLTGSSCGAGFTGALSQYGTLYARGGYAEEGYSVGAEVDGDTEFGSNEQRTLLETNGSSNSIGLLAGDQYMTFVSVYGGELDIATKNEYPGSEWGVYQRAGQLSVGVGVVSVKTNGGQAFSKAPDASHYEDGVWYGFNKMLAKNAGKQEIYKLDTNYSQPFVQLGGEVTVEKVFKELYGFAAANTGAAIAREAFPDGSKYAVVARDDDFADSLGAAGLAGVLEAPIVLTNRFGLSNAAREVLLDLGVREVFVIGGTGAISSQVDEDISALGIYVNERVCGYSAADTSLACAKLIADFGGSTEGAIVSISDNFQDALSISSFAYDQALPIILETSAPTAAGRHLPDGATALLAGRNVIAVGGTGALSDASLAGLNVVKRIYGETGYDTSSQIAWWLYDELGYDPDVVCIACGALPPKGTDALAGTALAGRFGGMILLASTQPDYGPSMLQTIVGFDSEGYSAFLEGLASQMDHVYILGGSYVIPYDLRSLISDIVYSAWGWDLAYPD